ncbi:hypothetical protein BDV27DRAFT_136858 [Aspergillus caelatus]|uniref:Uncharacterized protein n=1 Tax=Aspergillus caelatus TaxID=61420 RepID=A0A5N6ZP28_9EURO|nr:uncharacterized protein BDV27DRAFT_136858 [Aspergillus caelatus]KAE8358973.1 hypothetical protein BDV27DRAFT_136858 [Aspergillus caelatus]
MTKYSCGRDDAILPFLMPLLLSCLFSSLAIWFCGTNRTLILLALCSSGEFVIDHGLALLCIPQLGWGFH